MEEKLLKSYIEETVTPDEKRKVENWLNQDEGNRELLMTYAKAHFMLKIYNKILLRNVLSSYKRVQGKLYKHTPVRRLRVSVSVAASIFVVIGLSIFLLVHRSNNSNLPVQTVSTEGEKCSMFLLPDSTVVFLNAQSSLSYFANFGQVNREVSLIGEAFFKVRPNKKKPFLVGLNNKGVVVNVLGTSFNVRAYNNEKIIQTTLEEGSVSVEIRKQDNSTEHIVLSPSESLAVDMSTGKNHREIVDVDEVKGWMNNFLSFKDTPLNEVVQQLSLLFQKQIILEGKELNNYSFTGHFVGKDLSVILEYIKITSGIKSKKEGNAVVLYKKEEN